MATSSCDPRTARPRHPQRDDCAWLRRRYVQQGRSIDAIAAEVGCHRRAVRAALLRHGIERRGTGSPARPGAERQRVLELADEGVGLTEIERQTGVPARPCAGG